MARKRNPEIARMLGQRVRKLRMLASLTQEVFAERLGVQATAISRFENGTVGFSISVLCNIAEILGVPLPMLFAFDGHQHVELSADEQELIDVYRLLDNEGQAAVRRMMGWARKEH